MLLPPEQPMLHPALAWPSTSLHGVMRVWGTMCLFLWTCSLCHGICTHCPPNHNKDRFSVKQYTGSPRRSRWKQGAGQFPAGGESSDASFSPILSPGSFHCYLPHFNTWSTAGFNPKHRANAPHSVLPSSEGSLAWNDLPDMPPPIFPISIAQFELLSSVKSPPLPLNTKSQVLHVPTLSIGFMILLYCEFRISVLFPQLHYKLLETGVIGYSKKYVPNA